MCLVSLWLSQSKDSQFQHALKKLNQIYYLTSVGLLHSLLHRISCLFVSYFPLPLLGGGLLQISLCVSFHVSSDAVAVRASSAVFATCSILVFAVPDFASQHWFFSGSFPLSLLTGVCYCIVYLNFGGMKCMKALYDRSGSLFG